MDHSVTIKACAGLNGMKLGGEVLTVVQAMPDASPLVTLPSAHPYNLVLILGCDSLIAFELYPYFFV